MSIVTLLDDKEQKTRKQWLYLLVAHSLFLLIVFAFSPVPENVSLTLKINIFVFGTLFHILFLYIAYHCAYKKYGIRYLTFCLILGPIGILFDVISVFKLPIDFWTFRNLIDAFLFGAWYFLSLKLRKINKKLLQSAN